MAIHNQRIERRSNMAMAFQELFTAIVRLRYNRKSVSSGEDFRAHVKKALGVAMQDAGSAGYSREDIKVAAYVVVAFVDESVLGLNSAAFSGWEGRPLQVEIFGQLLAGEWFYDFVEQLLGRPDSAETADVLEVFYLCVLLGYLGRYSSEKGELGSTMIAIRDKMVRVRGAKVPLSPQGLLPIEAKLPDPTDPWLKRLALTAAAICALTLVVFVVSKLMLMSGSSGLAALAGR
jgi:type VI secretion system protein ImpK